MKAQHNPSQNDRIIGYLQEHDTITALDAQREFGCMRLAARIADLEKRGYSFSKAPAKVMNRYGQTCRVMAYSLEEEE